MAKKYTFHINPKKLTNCSNNYLKCPAPNIHNIDSIHIKQLSSDTTDVSFSKFKLIDNGEIIIKMKTLNNYSSSTFDEVTVKLLKLNIQFSINYKHIFFI